jgi:hypothetical protein
MRHRSVPVLLFFLGDMMDVILRRVRILPERWGRHAARPEYNQSCQGG